MKKTIDIAAPPERVWQVMVDVEHWNEWTASITSVKKFDAVPFAVGSRARVSQPKLRDAIWTVTQLEPGRTFTWTSGVPGLLRAIGSHTVEPTKKGTRATLSVEFRGLLGWLAAGAFGKLTEEYIGLEAAGLKRRCEL